MRYYGYVLVSLFLVCGVQAQESSLEARRADFKEFVFQFEDQYAYLDRAEKPWLTWEARYAKAVDEAKTQRAFDGVIEAALDEAHDFHAEVRSPQTNRWLAVPTFADVWAEWHDGKAVITDLRPGGDAARLGVERGDVVLQVDGKPVSAAVDARLGDGVSHTEPAGRTWALRSVLAGRSDEARDWVLERGGKRVEVKFEVLRRFGRPNENVSFRREGRFGVVRFNNKFGEQATVAEFDRALDALRDTDGMVIDLRDVPSGGDSSVALGVMGRFVSKMLPYQHHRIPNYGQADVERNWVEMIAPRGPWTYTKPVVVLVGHWTGSMAEGVAVGFDAMKRATVIGTPMAGLEGGVNEFRLSKTGVDVALPTEQIFHVDGTPRHLWKPPVLLADGDDALPRALALLRD